MVVYFTGQMVKSDNEESSPRKSHIGVENAKPKRRKRGKSKPKRRKDSGDSQPSGSALLGMEVSETSEIPDAQASGSKLCPTTEASESLVNPESVLNTSQGPLDSNPSFGTTWDTDDESETSESGTYSGQIIRPNAPHAPKNSTQFIIDDHNECHLYMSFETPNPYLTSGTAGDGSNNFVAEPIGEDAAYRDIDYQYVSPQDFDNSAYYDREFELSYKSNRFEQLIRLPRDELISGLRALEARIKELSDALVKENPSPILEKLQSDLLELQEKNCELKDTNTKLTALVMQNEKLAERWVKEEHEDRACGEQKKGDSQNVDVEPVGVERLSIDKGIMQNEKNSDSSEIDVYCVNDG